MNLNPCFETRTCPIAFSWLNQVKASKYRVYLFYP